jgi:hypothetical protein
MGSDFYLRRFRIVVSGAITKDITFFAETDSPNFGKNGDFSVNAYVQDALVSMKFHPAFILDAGLLLIPMTHQTLQGATSLNTLDYHSHIVKYPASKVWRDTGLVIRGLLLGDHLHYRVGVFRGVQGQANRLATDKTPLGDDLNPGSLPRITGTLRFNLLDPESDLFFGGTYLGKKKVVSIGVAADYQSKALLIGSAPNQSATDYMALGGDIFVDYPLNDMMEIVFQADLIQYKTGSLNLAMTGTAFFAEAGFRYGDFEPVIGFDKFNSASRATGLIGYHVGLNYWMKGHTANLKLDFGMVKDQAAQKLASLDEGILKKSATLQLQTYF